MVLKQSLAKKKSNKEDRKIDARNFFRHWYVKTKICLDKLKSHWLNLTDFLWNKERCDCWRYDLALNP